VLLARLRSAIEDVTGTEIAEAEQSMSFIELGLDSLALTQLALHLSNALSLKLTFRQLMEDVSSLELLLAHVDALMPADAMAAPTTSRQHPRRSCLRCLLRCRSAQERPQD
jgi:acyl carrier protein